MKKTTFICETANTNSNGLGISKTDLMSTLDTNNSTAVCVEQDICMSDGNSNAAIDEDMSGTLKVYGDPPVVNRSRSMIVRRLTPLECERLQGFPDDYTKIPYRGKPADECPDNLRYKAIGNSMAVPVMRWIGERMQKADERYIGSGDISSNRKGLLSKMRKK